MMRALSILLATTALAACTGRAPSTDTAGGQDADMKAGQQLAANVVAGVAQDVDHARIGALENDVAELQARIDTSNTAILEDRISALELRAASPPKPTDAAADPGVTGRRSPAAPLPSGTSRPAPADPTVDTR